MFLNQSSTQRSQNERCSQFESQPSLYRLDDRSTDIVTKEKYVHEKKRLNCTHAFTHLLSLYLPPKINQLENVTSEMAVGVGCMGERERGGGRREVVSQSTDVTQCVRSLKAFRGTLGVTTLAAIPDTFKLVTITSTIAANCSCNRITRLGRTAGGDVYPTRPAIFTN